MPGLDALPADQRAVLQLLLQKGRSYDEIARALHLEPAAVRRRAHAGLAALADPGHVGDDDRAQVADWLLGQDGAGAERTLQRDPAAREWASTLSDRLAPVSARPLPAVPPPDAPDGPDAPGPPGPPARRPVSRRGGAVLLAAGALAAVVVVLVLVLRGGDDPKPAAPTTAPATSTTSTTAQNAGKVLAQVNLQPTRVAVGAKAIGVAQISDVAGKQTLFAVADKLQISKNVAWAIWVLDAGGRPQWVGPFSEADENGRLYASGQVAGKLDLTRYKTMIVSREKPGRSPRQPGTIYLSGAIAPPKSGG